MRIYINLKIREILEIFYTSKETAFFLLVLKLLKRNNNGCNIFQ